MIILENVDVTSNWLKISLVLVNENGHKMWYGSPVIIFDISTFNCQNVTNLVPISQLLYLYFISTSINGLQCWYIVIACIMSRNLFEINSFMFRLLQTAEVGPGAFFYFSLEIDGFLSFTCVGLLRWMVIQNIRIRRTRQNIQYFGSAWCHSL